MVGGPGRGRSTLLWFVAGAVPGGAVSGAMLGIGGLLIRPMPRWLALTFIAATATLVLLRDTGLVAIPFPQNARQVRQTVVGMRPAVGGLMFGFELGTGARTYMTGAAPYVAAVAALVVADPVTALLVGAGSGLGRGLVPYDRTWQRDSTGWDAWVGRHGSRTLPILGGMGTTVVAAVAALN